jgi:hypothetical protein
MAAKINSLKTRLSEMELLTPILQEKAKVEPQQLKS